jgi:hypothetical protein
MIIGNPNLFALESEIMQAYERISLRALGFFVIHIGGRSYGIKDEDATMMAIAFDRVGRRIGKRGTHSVPAIETADAQTLAIAFSRSIFIEHPKDELFLGMSDNEFRQALKSGEIIWAPDGEEGFDDGSCVLQFDIGDMVRLVAFKRATEPLLDRDSLCDIWLTQDEFYAILQTWHESFEKLWKSLPKKPESFS